MCSLSQGCQKTTSVAAGFYPKEVGAHLPLINKKPDRLFVDKFGHLFWLRLLKSWRHWEDTVLFNGLDLNHPFIHSSSVGTLFKSSGLVLSFLCIASKLWNEMFFVQAHGATQQYSKVIIKYPIAAL